MTPLLQSKTNYVKPYFIRYIVGSAFSLMLIPWYLLNRCRCNIQLTWPMIKNSCGVKLLYNFQSYIWYLSLNATIPSINNTIVQSSVAIVYILSVLLLPNYNMSLIKNVAVLCCLSGVIVVGFGTRNDSDDVNVLFHNMCI